MVEDYYELYIDDPILLNMVLTKGSIDYNLF